MVGPSAAGSMFVRAPVPPLYRPLGSVEFAKLLVNSSDVATSPGTGFGPDGDGHVRFALVENEQRIAQAVRRTRRGLGDLAGVAG